ncbi:MAG: hypothetical protein V4730_11660 [Pseudomonadota bacterium]
MGLMSGFIGGVAEAGADILRDERKIEASAAASKSLADYNNELDIKKARVVEEMKAMSANRERTDQVARIDTAAGKIADTAVEGKRGLINSGIADKGSWTPEQQAAVDQSLGIDKAKVVADPKTRTQAAIATGDISPKDAAGMDSRAEIAAAKNDAYLANVQAKLDMAGDKLEMAKTIATIRASSGGGSDGKDPANAKMIEYLVKNGMAREQATSKVLGDNEGKTKDPVSLAAQLATAMIREGTIPNASELKAKGLTPEQYAMDAASAQIEAATKKFRPDGAAPATPSPAPKPAAAPGTPAPAKPAAPAGLPQGARQVGTSGGKPVYETPDGKRFIQK